MNYTCDKKIIKKSKNVLTENIKSVNIERYHLEIQKTHKKLVKSI